MRATLVALVLLLTACGGEPGATATVTLHALRGQWLVVNYWAVWCKPCITEIPELNAFGRHYPEVRVVGVNFDGETGAALAAQVEQLGIAFDILARDPAAELGIERPAVLPTTLIVNPEGVVVSVLLGPQTGEALAAAMGLSSQHESQE